jgi:histone H3/H4
LKTATEKALVQLGILKRIAEEKKKEELWNLVNKAIDVTNGAHEGAESGITKDADAKAKKAKRK